MSSSKPHKEIILSIYTLTACAVSGVANGIMACHLFCKKEHSGGPEVIEKVAGVDGTKDFDDAFHILGTESELKKFQVGILIKEDQTPEIYSKKTFEYKPESTKDNNANVRTMAEVKEYTLADVARNNGSGGQPVWIIIKDQVYDVSKFIDEHPGGPEVLTDTAGKDATKDFNDAGHSKDAIKMVKQYHIGQIVEAERKYPKSQSATTTQSNQEKRSCLSIATCGLCG